LSAEPKDISASLSHSRSNAAARPEPDPLVLVEYLLHLADSALILGHRLSEWTGHGPILEQDIAISNIALDLIGQARYLYQHAAKLIMAMDAKSIARPHFLPASEPLTEDSLAYLRDAGDFRNSLLVEQPNGDWARTTLRQFYFSAFQFYLFRHLQTSLDQQLAAIAEKSSKEIAYHLRWSSEWVIRLGDGTQESHRRMQVACADLEKYLPELFRPAAYELLAAQAGLAVDPSGLREPWLREVRRVFEEAGLSGALPDLARYSPHEAGKQGRHSEALGYVLAEMQFLQRAYPRCEW
jgi:ring-1,2-phenylacetyl-CoA epoxidase subunit PaaC